ncbi:MAG: hypothetical protein AMXMBFR4_30580 [Candidatus Hydrogenedentota bacterium]
MHPVDTAKAVDVLTHLDNFRRVQYELTEKEFLKGVLLHPQARTRLRLTWIFAVGVLVFSVWLMGKGAEVAGILFAVMAVGYPFLIRYLLLLGARKGYRSMLPVLSAPIELAFGTVFLTQRTGMGLGYFTWLYQVVRSRDFRLLGTSSQVFIIVPVRAFESPAVLEEFDNIVGELAQGRVIGKPGK